jgi:hypothetical protein
MIKTKTYLDNLNIKDNFYNWDLLKSIKSIKQISYIKLYNNYIIY